VLGTIFGLALVVGTLVAGVVTDRLGVITVLNVQGAGYIVAGLFVLALLPRIQTHTGTPVPSLDRIELKPAASRRALSPGGEAPRLEPDITVDCRFERTG
jgi:hypothetical protein